MASGDSTGTKEKKKDAKDEVQSSVNVNTINFNCINSKQLLFTLLI